MTDAKIKKLGNYVRIDYPMSFLKKRPTSYYVRQDVINQLFSGDVNQFVTDLENDKLFRCAAVSDIIVSGDELIKNRHTSLSNLIDDYLTRVEATKQLQEEV